jgi:threonine dehydratase
VITLEEIVGAADRLDGVANRTPVLTSRTLDGRVEGRMFLKAENLQRAGAFKFRGAYNKTASLPDEELERGVITLSSGNHAQALSLASSLCGTSAVVLMPEDAPVTKLEATRAYGAEVVLFDRYAEDFEGLLRRVAAERRLTTVHPFDDWSVMAGQGTVALEFLDDAGELDLLLVGVGGGGLIAGCAIAAKTLQPSIRIVGVEPVGSDDTRRSLSASRRIHVDVAPTIADGMQLPMPGELTFQVIRRHVEDVVLVTDAEILQAMAFLFDRMKVVVEPSGAAALAAALTGKVDVRGLRVGAILSGGNIGLTRFCELMGTENQPGSSALASNGSERDDGRSLSW